MNKTTNVTDNFTFGELCHSGYAVRHGIENIPDEESKENLIQLAVNLLEPLRKKINKPVVILSGYRSQKVNKGVGGSKTSQHMKGQAADIRAIGMTPKELYEFIKQNMIYDQLILEFDSWVHVSYKASENRQKSLLAFKSNGKTVYKIG